MAIAELETPSALLHTAFVTNYNIALPYVTTYNVNLSTLITLQCDELAARAATVSRWAANFLADTPSANKTSISAYVKPFVSGILKYAQMRQRAVAPAQKNPAFALTSQR
jgi:hypothetical protein